MVDESSSSDRTENVPTGKSERQLYWDSWREWFREDFLRACYVISCLGWDSLGAVQLRYVLDPWYPGQGAPPGWVFGGMAAFVILSVVGQVVLYRLWWRPDRPRPGHSPPRNLDEHYAQAQQKHF